MIYKYCPFCGKKLIFKIIGDEGEIPYCTVCEKPLFPTFSTCVISIIINEFDEIALIKQSYGDTQKYKCVAGFMKPNETAEECVSREIQEEIGLNALNVKYINSYFYEKCDQLMLGFCCKVKKSEFSLSSEVNIAKWFSYDDAVAMLEKSIIAKKLLLKTKEFVF